MNLKIHQATQIPRRSDLGHPPLSYAQSRLWFLDQFDPGMTAYNVTLAYYLKGELNKKVLELSFNEIIRRHEILRTSFPLINDEPIQKINTELWIPLQLITLRNIPFDQRLIEAQIKIESETRYQFDLARGPLIRTLLIEITDTEYTLVINMHHIITDGWSSSILLKELSQIYTGYVLNNQSPLPPLPIQYSDFAVWQRTWLQEGTLRKQLDYWRSKLEDIQNLEIPTDYVRPPIYSYEGAHLETKFPLSLKNQLEKICKDEKSTLFMVMLAAFQVLLHRYTGQDDIVVGTSIANRNHIDIENLIGFFVNTLVIRSNLSGNPTFREFLRQVRATSIDAYSHQDLPFEKLVEELKPERDLSRNPFFQITFLLQNLPPARFQLPGIQVKRLEIEGETSKFDLSLFVYIQDNELLVRTRYNTNIFKSETIERFLNYYQYLITNIVLNPEHKVGWYRITPDKDFNLITKTWNSAKEPYPDYLCIHNLIEEWAEKTPDRMCVVMDRDSISYSQLNSKANHLAQLLIENGIEPEITVGIIMERSLEMVIAIYSILKAGGAYVALDPSFPEERLAFLIEDSKCKTLVTQNSHRSKASNFNIPILIFDETSFDNQRFSNPGTQVRQENLAYIMYTSGSTGKPKGVSITHANILGLIFGYKKVTLDGPRRIGTTVAPFNFDTSVEEIFSVLCFGGTLHIIQPDLSLDGELFAEYLVKHRITTSYIVPDLLLPIADHLRLHVQNLSLRCLITGLAPKRFGQLQPYRELSANLRILNAYGPTEVTYGATAYEFSSADDLNRSVPIGVPFPNYQAYIVDKYLEPVPIGVKGELLIGGTGISRGYNNAPGLTAEKIIPDPFSGEFGQRLYKTGDFARFLPDGNIEFLGRADDQVKVRGYRIELGEIAAVLNDHPQVEQTVVVTHEFEPGDLRLTAYIQNERNHSISIEELRDYLVHRLPGYMIPNYYVFMDEFPLLPNGKINRKALPIPDLSNQLTETQYKAPESSTDKLIAKFWSEVLGIERVGLKDNFFALGGHSLLATKIVSRIREVFRVELPFRVFFHEPTVERISEHIRNQDNTPGRSEKIAELMLKIKSMSNKELKEAIQSRKDIHNG